MSTQGVAFTCKPGRGEGKLIFAYRVTNESTESLYVIDAMPVLNAERRFTADADYVVTIFAGSGLVITARCVPPRPTDRLLAAPMPPLAARLEPGASLDRKIEVRLPWAESSPYFPELTLRDYELRGVTTTLFAVGFWRAGLPGLAAAPAPFAPDLFQVVTPNPASDTTYLSQRFPTAGLEILRRTDAFVRALPIS